MRGRRKVSGATKVMFLILRSCALGGSWPSGGHSLSLSHCESTSPDIQCQMIIELTDFQILQKCKGNSNSSVNTPQHTQCTTHTRTAI